MKGGEGAISGNLQEKMLHGRTFVFGVAPRFDAADAADGWLDGGRSAPLAEWTARGGGWLPEGGWGLPLPVGCAVMVGVGCD